MNLTLAQQTDVGEYHLRDFEERYFIWFSGTNLNLDRNEVLSSINYNDIKIITTKKKLYIIL